MLSVFSIFATPKTYHLKKVYPFLLLFFIVISCSKTYKDQSAPAILSIPDAKVNAKEGEGTSSDDVTEAWVYLDGQLQGIYSLPAERIPILATGEHRVTVRAGIKKSGSGNNRVDYPFFEPFETYLTFSEGETVEITPEFSYYENLFMWQEDFESIGFSFEKGPYSDTNFVSNSATPFEGNSSGKAVLTTSQSDFTAQTAQSFNFPSSVPLFLEMDYLTNETFEVGVLQYTVEGTYYQPAVYVVANKADENGEPQWQKMYVDLSNSIYTLNNAGATTPVYDVYFNMDNQNGTKEAILEIDNIKIIYFE